MLLAALVALGAGAASVLAYAPFGLFPLTLASVAVLVALVARARSTRRAFTLGLAWGFGAQIAGVSWLVIALERFGGMPLPLAVLAIALFCAYLALYAALAAAAFHSLRRRWQPAPVAAAALFGALWLVSEWLRGVVFTGFPWLALGYSQTPPSPLAGFLPLLGVYGVGGLAAFVAALLVLADWRSAGGRGRAVVVVLGVLGLGAGLLGVAWTTPEGEPVRVALVQTNFAQDLKWDRERFAAILRDNAVLVREALAGAGEGGQGDARAHGAGEAPPVLVVLPETTVPALTEHLPAGYLDELGALAQARGASLVLGVFERNAAGHIFNAAISLGEGAGQRYAKHHLVPFGEYSPPLFGWFYRLARIPMSDQTPGAPRQAPLALGTQRVAVNICYEDLFGAELIRSLPAASVLLNLSNLAWYGRSLAQPQHLQIARVRALETGRPMLRATNTGMTAVVQPDGTVSAVLPQFERGVLHAAVQGFAGLTPYARGGDLPALALAALCLLGCRWRAWRGRRRPQRQIP